MCFWHIMPQLIVNFQIGKDRNDTYFDTSRKMSQEMTMCNTEALIFYFLESMFNVDFQTKWSNVNVKILSTNRKMLSQGIFMWNIKALALTIPLIWTIIKVFETHGEFLSQRMTILYIKARALTFQILSTMFKLQGQGHRINMFVFSEKYCHKKYSNEISKL